MMYGAISWPIARPMAWPTAASVAPGAPHSQQTPAQAPQPSLKPGCSSIQENQPPGNRTSTSAYSTRTPGQLHVTPRSGATKKAS
jgi:hypothetical protein